MRLPWHSFHFIGIGGIGMSGLANVLLGLGYQISGSDLHFNPLLKRLATQGATIYSVSYTHLTLPTILLV